MKTHAIQQKTGQGNELVIRLPAIMFLIYMLVALLAYCKGWWPFN
jgi:hypothetical protein